MDCKNLKIIDELKEHRSAQKILIFDEKQNVIQNH